MKDEILIHLNEPRQLEKLYRENKTAFKTEFNVIYPGLTDHKLADYWNERLNYESSGISWGSKQELIFVLIAAIVAGIVAKFPSLFNLNAEIFYQRNIGFIVFPMLTAYFAWRKNLSSQKIAVAAIAFLIASIFINMLPADSESDTLILSCIHLPILLWAVLGFSYAGAHVKNFHNRLDFLRYNGDLVIMTGLLVIAGVMLSGITIGLFSVIGLHIADFYVEYIGIFGAAALPIIATYITQTNPQLVNKISPVIAKIFSPLVLIMLVAYLVAIFFSGKDPYKDRNFLMIFNFLLIGVMAIILFSVAETSKKKGNRADSFILLALSVVTVIVNGIALSAILFRISEWGITPNRLAILGANVLMLANLFVITVRLSRSLSKKSGITDVGNSIAMFLPIYIIWVIIVTFIFPLLFHFI